jgi:[ribosomal protein S18]-alanine N-acetyltransferase
MYSALIVRNAEYSDIERIVAIGTQSGINVWKREDYVSEIVRADSYLTVSETKGVISGFLSARFVSFDQSFEIYNVAISSEYKKQGHGTALVERLCEYCRISRVGNVYLEVRESNVSAVEFYKKNGFTICGKRKNFYSSPVEDAILMKKTIRY